jgi:hypothetical protein
VIVVTGPGRSGTSLAMKVLSECGLRRSAAILPASEQNPAGIYESQEILAAQNQIMDRVFYGGIVPRPGDWMGHGPILPQIEELETVLRREVCHDGGVWGFKDPRTSLLIPIWIRLFNRNRITPTYIFCCREPAQIIESFWLQYGISPSRAELVWFTRSAWFLKYVGCRVFILHYGDWLSRPSETLDALLRYVGLPQPDPSRATEILDACIDRRLVRVRSVASPRLSRPISDRLRCRLADSKYDRFNRVALQKDVDSAFRSIMDFAPVHEIVYNLLSKIDEMKKS